MDGFTGFRTDTTDGRPDAVAVMDHLHVVRLAGDGLDECRRHVQQDTHGHRAARVAPLCRAPDPYTGTDLLTDKQPQQLQALFATNEHVEVEATWGTSTSA